MSSPSAWQGFYVPLPDGRSKITAAALIALTIKDSLRVLDSLLEGVAARILLLDKPMKVGEEVAESDIPEYYLRRIPIKDLPGWPPDCPSVEQCRLAKASVGPAGVDLELELDGRTVQARVAGCPPALSKCLEATLRQPGVKGMTLRDIQEMRLIGAG